MSSRPWRSILVAVRDPAERRQVAIGKAARLAAASGARITLFHAFATPFPLPQPLPTEPVAVIEAVRRQRHAELLRHARPLRAAGIKVECEVAWDFPAAHAIIRSVLARKADLVMAESHRRSRLTRWLLANNDWELIRECPCPVWFVKHERLAKRPVVLAAVDPTHAHAKPSGLDDRLLACATALSRQLGGTTRLVHVEDVTRAESLGSGSPAGTRTLAAVRRLGQRHGIAVEAQAIRAGVPAAVLARTARGLKADVLVMGAISRSGLRHAFIGSTAEAVIDEVACDLLIARPRGFRSTVTRQRPKLPKS
jgi:universal stress protein E